MVPLQLYIEATVTEVETLEAMDAWEVVDQIEDMNVLQSTLAFKLKCFLMKLSRSSKSSLCQRRSTG